MTVEFYDHASMRNGADWLGSVEVGGVDSEGQLSLKRIEKTTTWTRGDERIKQREGKNLEM